MGKKEETWKSILFSYKKQQHPYPDTLTSQPNTKTIKDIFKRKKKISVLDIMKFKLFLWKLGIPSLEGTCFD